MAYRRTPQGCHPRSIVDGREVKTILCAARTAIAVRVFKFLRLKIKIDWERVSMEKLKPHLTLFANYAACLAELTCNSLTLIAVKDCPSRAEQSNQQSA